MPSTENGRRSRMARRRAPAEHRPHCCCHQWSMSAAQSARRLSHGTTILCALSWRPHGEACLCHVPVSPPMAWITRGEEGAGGHMVKAPRPPEAEIPRSSDWPHQLVVPRHELLIPFWKHELARIPLALRMRRIRCVYPDSATILQVALWPNG